MKRREFFKTIAGMTGAAVVAPLLLTTLKAQAEESRRKKPETAGGVELVDPKDTVAKGVQYVEKSKIADKNCANCNLFVPTGEVNGKKVGSCIIFGKKQVLAEAHCISWVKKA